MSIKMTQQELNRISRGGDIHTCLDKTDVKSLQSLAAEISVHDDDNDILRVARRIIKAESRNAVANGNQRNIDVIVNTIMEQTNSGDVISLNSCYKLVRECRLNNEYATYNALIMALAQLTKSGYLISEVVKYENNYGGRQYMKIYTVV